MFVLEDDVIRKLINEKQFNPWTGTCFEGYKSLNNIQKGNLGEDIVKIYMKNLNHTIEERANRTDGYDAVINGLKVEIKFSLAQTDNVKKCVVPNRFIMNHVSENKEWDRLIFLGVNLNGSYWLKYLTKEDFKEFLKDKFFNTQQGGSSSGNDDYMCSGNKLIAMLNELKDVAEW